VANVENNTPVINADVADVAPTLTQRLVAELAGTFILVFSVIGTAQFASQNTNWVGVALAAGIAVLGSAYAFGHISGGHFNPAVSLGAAASGRFAWSDVLPYIAAQIIGGALATTVLLGIRSGAGGDVFSSFTATSNGFDEHSPLGFNLPSVLLAEVVATAIFLYIILGVTDRRAPSGFAPIAIGLTLAALHLVTIPVSNASLNPARSIATAIYGGPGSLEQLWVFIVAPIVGALVAGFTYGFLFDRTKRPVSISQ
jgi:aquaporin Z